MLPVQPSDLELRLISCIAVPRRSFLQESRKYIMPRRKISMAEQPKSYEKVLTYLEDSLRRGQLSLGDPLPPERELAEQLGISRNSVREAVRLLEHMGFIVSNQGAGNFICCNIQRNLQDSFDLLMLLQQIDYRRLGELRAGLELQAALLALGRITDEQVRELSGMVEEMASCSSKRAAQLDKQLHDTIAAISEMRDRGSAFVKDAPAVIVVLGDETKTDLWVDNCAISATFLQLAATSLGLGSCWVHVNARPRVSGDPASGTAEEYIRNLLGLKDGMRVLCVVAVGYPAD